MITQELIDYVKTQLAADVTREKLTSDLLGQGWTADQINEAFIEINKPVSSNETSIQDISDLKNSIWASVIPKLNWLTAIVSLSILFFIDVPILIDSPDLAPFFYLMLGTLALYSVFFYLENYMYKHSLSPRPRITLDFIILILVVLRNIAVVLSVIPLIQLLGMAAIGLGGIPWLLAYAILLFIRFRKDNSETTTA